MLSSWKNVVVIINFQSRLCAFSALKGNVLGGFDFIVHLLERVDKDVKYFVCLQFLRIDEEFSTDRPFTVNISKDLKHFWGFT